VGKGEGKEKGKRMGEEGRGRRGGRQRKGEGKEGKRGWEDPLNLVLPEKCPSYATVGYLALRLQGSIPPVTKTMLMTWRQHDVTILSRSARNTVIA